VQKEVQSQPQLGLQQRPQGNGNQFAIIMVDLDIPTNNQRQTSTLLHWMQTGLTLSNTASRLGNSNNVFKLNIPNNVAAAAAYIGPNPPARAPLSHRYAQILVDTSGEQAQSTNTLNNAAKTRMGFNVQQVLQQAGLSGRVVAGNFFNVTNPGPVSRVGTNGDSVSPDAAKANSSASMTMTMPMPTTSFVPAAGHMVSPQTTLVAGLVAAAAVFLRF